MKKIILIIIAVTLASLLNSKFNELAGSLGFAEFNKETILINTEKMKVKCQAYALGWFDEIQLENNLQACVNEHEANGYHVMASARK